MKEISCINYGLSDLETIHYVKWDLYLTKYVYNNLFV